MSLTVQQVNHLLTQQKHTISPMEWRAIKHRNTLEYQTSVALSVNGEIVESLRLLCSYVPLPEVLGDAYSFSLLFNNQRIYAIDKEPLSKQHRNNQAGNGREFYGKLVRGTHEHTWSSEGYGYAEPLSLPHHFTHQDYWKYVSSKTTILLNGKYAHPLDGLGGQISLFGGG